MNPFKGSSLITKKDFYLDQISTIKPGPENAILLNLCDGDDKGTARMYINKLSSETGLSYKTKSSGGELWVARA